MLTWLMGLDSAGSRERLSAFRRPAAACTQTDAQWKIQPLRHTEEQKEIWNRLSKKSQPGPVREWLNNISDHRLVCSFLIKLKDMEEDITHDAKIPVFNCYLYQHHVPHTEQQTNCYWRSMRKDIKNKVKWYVLNKWFVCVCVRTKQGSEVQYSSEPGCDARSEAPAEQSESNLPERQLQDRGHVQMAC